MDREIDVGNDFHYRLTDRSENQTGNKYNAVSFRNKYLSKLDKKEIWREDNCKIILDFSNVKKLSPGFANEAFGYFAKYTKNKKEILEHIIFKNISKVKMNIILDEIDATFMI